MRKFFTHKEAIKFLKSSKTKHLKNYLQLEYFYHILLLLFSETMRIMLKYVIEKTEERKIKL